MRVVAVSVAVLDIDVVVVARATTQSTELIQSRWIPNILLILIFNNDLPEQIVGWVMPLALGDSV